MSDLHIVTMAADAFEVKDFQAFKTDMEANGAIYDTTHSMGWATQMAFWKRGENRVWMLGSDVGLTIWDNNHRKEIDLVPIIQQHMAPNAIAIFYTVTMQMFEDASAEVHVITPTDYAHRSLKDIGQELAETMKKRFIDSLPKDVQLLRGSGGEEDERSRKQ